MKGESLETKQQQCALWTTSHRVKRICFVLAFARTWSFAWQGKQYVPPLMLLAGLRRIYRVSSRIGVPNSVVPWYTVLRLPMIVSPRLLFIIITHVHGVVNMYIACRPIENCRRCCWLACCVFLLMHIECPTTTKFSTKLNSEKTFRFLFLQSLSLNFSTSALWFVSCMFFISHPVLPEELRAGEGHGSLGRKGKGSLIFQHNAITASFTRNLCTRVGVCFIIGLHTIYQVAHLLPNARCTFSAISTATVTTSTASSSSKSSKCARLFRIHSGLFYHLAYTIFPFVVNLNCRCIITFDNAKETSIDSLGFMDFAHSHRRSHTSDVK